MTMRTKAAIWAAVTVGAVAVVTSAAFSYVGARELGRSDPKQAANYRLPWFNFSETYTDGVALGIVLGSTKAEAIEAAERDGFTVEPSGWGDNRAGGADLYDRSTLHATMLRQPSLSFYDATDLSRVMIVRFREDRVASVDVHYINNEVI